MSASSDWHRSFPGGRRVHPAANPLEALLDLIDFGIILADRAGTVMAANAAAREIAGSWELLAISDTEPGRPPVLSHTMILEAAERVSLTKRAGPRKVAEVVLRAARRTDSLLVTAVSLPLGARTSEAIFQTSCALFFRDGSLRSSVRAGTVLKQFGFTPAEAELAEALLDGLTLDQCCTRLGRSRNTLRSRMKDMLAKTGVHRQGQLIALILKSAPQIRLVDEAQRPVGDRRF